MAYAIRNLQKKCFIVTRDWLEDSIERKRKLGEKKYFIQAAFKKERAKRALELKALRAAQPLEQPENFINDSKQYSNHISLQSTNCQSDLYHVYSDETYFRYEVTITRINEDNPENEQLNERYVLFVSHSPISFPTSSCFCYSHHGTLISYQLWESNSNPHLYVCASKYFKKSGSHPLYWRANESDRKFSDEFREFQEFFEKKTGIGWMERLAKAGTTPPTCFQYRPPVRALLTFLYTCG